MACSILFCALSASSLDRLRVDNSLEAFLDRDDPVLREYNAFREQFGRDHWVLIGISTDEVFALDFLEKLRAFQQDLSESVPHVVEITSVLNARWVHSESDELIVSELAAEWPETPEDVRALRERTFANPIYRNTLVTGDGRLATVTLEPDAYSSATGDGSGEELASAEGDGPAAITDAELDELVIEVRKIAARYDADDFSVSIAGAPVVAQRLNEQVAQDLNVLTAAALLVFGLVLLLLFRSLWAVLVPTAVIVLSFVSTFGTMALLDIPLSLTTQLIPTFLLVAGMCVAIHIQTIFYQVLGECRTRQQAVETALRRTGVPVILTSLTTAGSLASLAAAEITPVRELGLMAPAGVLFATLYSLTTLPALLVIAGAPRRRAPARSEGRLRRLIVAVGLRCHRRHRTVLVVTGLVLGASLLGALRLGFSQDYLLWFPEDEPVRRATELLGDRLGGVLTVEAVVAGRDRLALYQPALLSRLERFESQALELSVDGLSATHALSLVDLLAEIHQALDGASADRIPRSREAVAQELLLFESSGSDDLEALVDPDYRRARLTLRVPWVDMVAYPRFIEELEALGSRTLEPELTLTVTGLTALFARTISALQRSMAVSYAIAVAVVLVLMAALLGGWRIGLMCMLPNVAPLLLALGLMGWLGIALDLSNLMIGAVVIGLAVDDTIHFMYGYFRERRRGAGEEGAIRDILASAGVAMFSTSLVVASGFSMLVFGHMTHLDAFGLLIAFAALTAFAADISIGPALVRAFPGLTG